MKRLREIDPFEWRDHADRCNLCVDFKARRGVTEWLDGYKRPVRIGWYERLFTDGLFRHWWDGKHWRGAKDWTPHWRQVGSYPCWRGRSPRRVGKE